MEPSIIRFSLVVDPPAAPTVNMALDEELAAGVREGSVPATLRLYRWNQPAISLGRRQQPDDLPPSILKERLPLVRRPTGGGAVIHRLDELTYAFCTSHSDLPPGVLLREMPRFLHRSLLEIVVSRHWIPAEDLHVIESNRSGPAALCFLYPVCGDLLYLGRKVAGAALRVWRDGILVQGSIQGFPVGFDQLVDAFVSLCQGGVRYETNPSFHPLHRCRREGPSLC